MKDLKDFEKWLEKARKDENEQLPLVWELMKSPFIEYHYSLIKDKSLSSNFRRDLMSRFNEHHEDGSAFLLSKLNNNEDDDFYAEIIYLLGRLHDNRKYPDREKVLVYTRMFALSSDDNVRDRAIIVLGWIGSIQDVPLLANRLLEDTNAKCRAWAASSFMQIWFRNKSEILVEKTLPYLYKAIKHEQDYFVQTSIIGTIQEFTKKHFGLSQTDLYNVNEEKIEQAKLKINTYFQKLYKG